MATWAHLCLALPITLTPRTASRSCCRGWWNSRARFDVWELQRAGGLAPRAETVISANGARVAHIRSLSDDRIMATTDGGET